MKTNNSTYQMLVAAEERGRSACEVAVYLGLGLSVVASIVLFATATPATIAAASRTPQGSVRAIG
ncbi:MAG: hypothetical protein M3R59_02425 [Verrucomicrobiota bacterium]|nr:hypothetical protein [Verrucomicrobiota bacterium]